VTKLSPPTTTAVGFIPLAGPKTSPIPMLFANLTGNIELFRSLRAGAAKSGGIQVKVMLVRSFTAFSEIV